MEKKNKRSRRNITYLTDLSDLHGKHTGQKCFIVGSGPTLAFLDLKEIHNHVVISVNSSIILMPWKTGELDNRYWISTDPLCLNWDYFYTHVVRANCTRLVRTSWRHHQDQIENFTFRFFKPRTKPGYAEDDEGITGNSSVLSALDLALLMGVKKLYLLGVDQRMLHDKSHFWQFLSKKEWPQKKGEGKEFRPSHGPQNRMFKRNIGFFKGLKGRADKLGAKIYNCSNISTLEIFEKISLDDALKMS